MSSNRRCEFVPIISASGTLPQTVSRYTFSYLPRMWSLRFVLECELLARCSDQIAVGKIEIGKLYIQIGSGIKIETVVLSY